MHRVIRLLGLALAILLAAPVPTRATVSTTTSVVEYTCNGTVKTFTVPFKFLAQEHLRVSRVQLADPYTESVLPMGSIYTVGGAGSATGGTVALVTPSTGCATGYKLRIRRLTPRTQGTSLSTQGPYNPKALEAMADRQAMIAQELNDGALLSVQNFNFLGPTADSGLVTATGSSTPIPLSSRFAAMPTPQNEGAVADGVTNDAAALQAWVNAGSLGRGCLVLPGGKYNLGTTTLTIPKTVCIQGGSASFGDSNNVATIIYSGTGAAVQLGGGGADIYNASLRDFRIEATGTAASSATAVGLLLLNSNYSRIDNVTVRGFRAGVGILSTSDSTGGGVFGALNTFTGCMLWDNKIGYKFDGVDATHGDYAATIVGGTAIGVASSLAGSKGLWVTPYAAGVVVYGTDFETFEYDIDLFGDYPTSGGSVSLIGTRTEFEGLGQIRINAGMSHTSILGHRFFGGTSVDSWLIDNGSATTWVDSFGPVSLLPSGMWIKNNIPISMSDHLGNGFAALRVTAGDVLEVGHPSFYRMYARGLWFFDQGIDGNGNGLKHKRISTGSVAGASRADVAFSWTAPFTDTAYTATCTAEDTSGVGTGLRVERVRARTGAGLTIQVANDNAGALTGVVSCVAIHD